MATLLFGPMVVMALLSGTPSPDATTPSAADMTSGIPTAMLERGIRSHVRGSPHDYVAAVVEPAGPLQCEEKDHQEICRSKVRVIELLAAQPSPDLSEFYLIGGSASSNSSGSVVERVLVFATPMPELADAYGATYMFARPDEATVEQLRRAIRAATGE